MGSWYLPGHRTLLVEGAPGDYYAFFLFAGLSFEEGQPAKAREDASGGRLLGLATDVAFCSSMRRVVACLRV